MQKTTEGRAKLPLGVLQPPLTDIEVGKRERIPFRTRGDRLPVRLRIVCACAGGVDDGDAAIRFCVCRIERERGDECPAGVVWLRAGPAMPGPLDRVRL